jgi:hypothetical protein
VDDSERRSTLAQAGAIEVFVEDYKTAQTGPPGRAPLTPELEADAAREALEIVLGRDAARELLENAEKYGRLRALQTVFEEVGEPDRGKTAHRRAVEVWAEIHDAADQVGRRPEVNVEPLRVVAELLRRSTSA